MKSLKLIGLALGASLALSTTALAQDISIAVAGPMTGGESAFGRQMKNGAEQAVADINAAGGVLGKKLALQIGPASTNPLFTERKLWNVARVCGRDDQQGLVAADYIVKNYKGKNVAILNDKTTYGKGLADETKKALNKA